MIEKDKRTIRTPAEILADLNAKRDAILSKIARERATSRPSLKSFLEIVEASKAEGLELKAGLSGSNPATLYSARIEKCEAKLLSLQAEKALAEALSKGGATRVAFLESLFGRAADFALSSDKVTEEEILAFLDKGMAECPTDSPEIQDLRNEYQTFRDNYRALSQAPKSGGTNPINPETMRPYRGRPPIGGWPTEHVEEAGD